MRQYNLNLIYQVPCCITGSGHMYLGGYTVHVRLLLSWRGLSTKSIAATYLHLRDTARKTYLLLSPPPRVCGRRTHAMEGSSEWHLTAVTTPCRRAFHASVSPLAPSPLAQSNPFDRIDLLELTPEIYCCSCESTLVTQCSLFSFSETGISISLGC